ncbi:Proteasome assembly chaperone [Apis cerana cerana]|uniref:Proteasome assembly chaperone n=1 Tax=Apis cerana cerana TaxID=94128 RepID=A0A2A3ESI3_APICC|nr:Proteasome assembly chaperone [Apis cerana cerana]
MKDHACVDIHGHHTDIILKVYSNRLLLIVTQFKKFGSLISINRGSLFNQYNNSIYSTKVLFGKDDVEVIAAARFITEQINTDKPLLISISLKNYDSIILKTIVTIINDMIAQ